RMFFFFQAEDGIRDLTVTGVQTCALPISRLLPASRSWLPTTCRPPEGGGGGGGGGGAPPTGAVAADVADACPNRLLAVTTTRIRSEERRVGKEMGARGGTWPGTIPGSGCE